MKDLIRFAAPADAGRILKIYAPYITDTVISFEYDVPSLADFTARVEKIASKYPYLVYERDGVVVGYAYASPYIERAAYDYTVDLIAGKTSANVYTQRCWIFLQSRAFTTLTLVSQQLTITALTFTNAWALPMPAHTR